MLQASMLPRMLISERAADPGPSTSTSSQPASLCRICGTVADGTHFGAEACRACAAFFRRAVRSTRPAVCRQGDHSCMQIDPTDLRCRKCRLTKCIQAGMQRSQVQPRKREKDESDESSVTSPLSSTSTSSQSVPSVPEDQPLANFIVARISDRSSSPLLERIRINYRKLIARRLEIESSYLTNPPIDGAQVACTYAELNAILRSESPLVADFACTTFPELGQLGAQDKVQFFKHFVIMLFYLESYHRSSLLYDIEGARRSLTLLTCLDLNNLEPIVRPVPAIARHAANLMIRNRSQRPRLVEMLKSFKRISFTEVEISALVALVLTSHAGWGNLGGVKPWGKPRLCAECSELSESIAAACKPIKDAIVVELSRHYKSVAVGSRSAMRMGDILAFLSEFQVDFSHAQKRDHYVVSLFTESDDTGYLFSLVK